MTQQLSPELIHHLVEIGESGRFDDCEEFSTRFPRWRSGSLWVDRRAKRDGERVSYIVQEPLWGMAEAGGAKSAARKDHDEKLTLVFDGGYEAFGYLVEAKDKNVVPREILETITSFIFKLQLEKQPDGTVLGYPVARIEIR